LNEPESTDEKLNLWLFLLQISSLGSEISAKFPWCPPTLHVYSIHRTFLLTNEPSAALHISMAETPRNLNTGESDQTSAKLI